MPVIALILMLTGCTLVQVDMTTDEGGIEVQPNGVNVTIYEGEE